VCTDQKHISYSAAVADMSNGMQLIARDPLQLRSSWDSYPNAVHGSSGMQDQQPFSTWKFRSDGESKRIIDYIWYVQLTFAAMCSITLLLMSTICVRCQMCRNTGSKLSSSNFWFRYSVDDRLQLVSHWQLPSEAAIGATGNSSLTMALCYLSCKQSACLLRGFQCSQLNV